MRKDQKKENIANWDRIANIPTSVAEEVYMRLGREQHKAMVQLKREWNQPDAAGDNKLNVEKEQSSREKKSKSWELEEVIWQAREKLGAARNRLRRSLRE